MGGSGQQLFFWLIPVALGLGVWRITESITRQKISLMALVSVVGSLIGWYLGQALTRGPDATAGQVAASALIGAVVVAAIFDFVLAKMRAPDH